MNYIWQNPKLVKISKTITLLFCIFFGFSAMAAVSPAGTLPAEGIVPLKVHNLKKITGKRLGFFQKIKLKLALASLRRLTDDGITDKQKQKAELSMILGISSIVLLFLSSVAFLGFAGLLALPAGILAVVFGAQSLKGNSNTKGIIGIVTGGVTVLLIALAIMVLAVFLATWA